MDPEFLVVEGVRVIKRTVSYKAIIVMGCTNLGACGCVCVCLYVLFLHNYRMSQNTEISKILCHQHAL